MITEEQLKEIRKFEVHFFEESSFNDKVKGARYSVEVFPNEYSKKNKLIN